ncbi:MAG: DsbA family protein [Kiloniellales bacterium]|nr:DsbA family protein [Kiloniellales bacterium]
MVAQLSSRAALSAAALLLIASVFGSAGAEERRFDAADQDEIREIVREYLIEHPEVIVEAINVYQERQRVAAKERQQQAVVALQSALAEDPDAPVLGNPDGDVMVVEFFDYNCGYCKTVAEGIRQTIAEDPGIRLVMKEFPILGPDSQFAARAALAAAEQDRYEELHFALMTAPGRLNQQKVMSVAGSLGLDLDKLRRDMNKPEVDAALRRNFELAEGLEITGTPAFVIGSQVFPGALNMETLRQVVAEARANPS